MASDVSNLESQVSKALLITRDLGDAVFEIAVMNGIVTLKGTVSSEESILLAETIVWGQTGVVEVINNLKALVYRPPDSEQLY